MAEARIVIGVFDLLRFGRREKPFSDRPDFEIGADPFDVDTHGTLQPKPEQPKIGRVRHVEGEGCIALEGGLPAVQANDRDGSRRHVKVASQEKPERDVSHDVAFAVAIEPELRSTLQLVAGELGRWVDAVRKGCVEPREPRVDHTCRQVEVRRRLGPNSLDLVIGQLGAHDSIKPGSYLEHAVHSAHAAHATHSAHSSHVMGVRPSGRRLLWDLRHERFGCQQ